MERRTPTTPAQPLPPLCRWRLCVKLQPPDANECNALSTLSLCGLFKGYSWAPSSSCCFHLVCVVQCLTSKQHPVLLCKITSSRAILQRQYLMRRIWALQINKCNAFIAGRILRRANSFFQIALLRGSKTVSRDAALLQHSGCVLSSAHRRSPMNHKARVNSVIF